MHHRKILSHDPRDLTIDSKNSLLHDVLASIARIRNVPNSYILNSILPIYIYSFVTVDFSILRRIIREISILESRFYAYFASSRLMRFKRLIKEACFSVCKSVSSPPIYIYIQIFESRRMIKRKSAELTRPSESSHPLPLSSMGGTDQRS